MIWNGVKAASNQAKERIDRKLLASFGSNNRHGNPRHVDIKSSLGGGHCRIDLYEKATERSGWLLGCVTLRELLGFRQRFYLLFQGFELCLLSCPSVLHGEGDHLCQNGN